MSNISDFLGSPKGGGVIFPLPDSVKWDVKDRLLPLVDNDGSGLLMNSNSDITKYDTNGNIVWTISPSNIHVDCDFLVKVHPFYDSGTDLLWGLWGDYATSPYTHHLASIDCSTGVINYKGAFQKSNADGHESDSSFSVYRQLDMASDGNILYDVQNTAQDHYEMKISSTNGSLLYETSSWTSTKSAVRFGYISKDRLSSIYIDDSTYDIIIMIQRGHNYAQAYTSQAMEYPSRNTSGYDIKVSPWMSDYVIISDVYGLDAQKLMLRSEFDKWMNDIADYYGLPD